MDFFNPNTWTDDHEYRIYADDYANKYAIVDKIDYLFLIQWRWKLKQSRSWANTKKPKEYVVRTGCEIIGKDNYEDGKRTRNRRQSMIFLHVIVMERKGFPKPITNSKIIVDHANGNELDCRRHNLRYATIGFNNKNIYGSHERMLIEEYDHAG